MTHTFYWHDYETWGADPSRDRPAQFAGLRTDADLNPIGEPLAIYCRPADDTQAWGQVFPFSSTTKNIQLKAKKRKKERPDP